MREREGKGRGEGRRAVKRMDWNDKRTKQKDNRMQWERKDDRKEWDGKENGREAKEGEDIKI